MVKNFVSKGLFFIFALPSFLFLQGCAATLRAPVYQSPEFTSGLIDEITILPVVDLRVDKSSDPAIEKVDEWISNYTQKLLTKYGYKVTILSDRKLVEGLTEPDLSNKDAGWIKHAAPTGSNWVMVIGLVDCMAKLTFGSTGNAEVTGYMYNKTNKSIIWHDKGVGKTGQGGLMGMAMKGMMAHDATTYATGNLLGSIPKKSK